MGSEGVRQRKKEMEAAVQPQMGKHWLKARSSIERGGENEMIREKRDRGMDEWQEEKRKTEKYRNKDEGACK